MNFNESEVLIVDDDKIHAVILEQKLNEIGFLKITSCNTFREAEMFLETNDYEFLFLDFYLDDGKTCQDLNKKVLQNTSVSIIYITSFYDDSTFSQIAKRKNIAFLSKNASTFEIKKELELMTTTSVESTSPLKKDDFLFVKKGKDIVKIMIEELMYIEVDGKYLNLECKSGTYVIRKTLTEFNEVLPKNFIKIHQSIIININHLNSVNVDQSMVSINGVKLPISRAHRKSLMTNRYFS